MPRPIRPVPTSLDEASIEALALAIGGGGAEGADRELSHVSFRVTNAFTGASVGDLILGLVVVNLSAATPAVEGAIIWYNQTTATTLASPPLAANLEPIALTGLTAAQLAAAALMTDAKGEAIRALLAGTLAVNPTADGETVTALADGAGVRQAVTSPSAAFALPTMGASRRVRIRCSVGTYLRFGTSSGVTASVAGTSIPFEANAPEYVVVPANMTHFAVIREGSVDGNIHIQPTVD